MLPIPLTGHSNPHVFRRHAVCTGVYYSRISGTPVEITDPRGGVYQAAEAKDGYLPEAPFHHYFSFFPKVTCSCSCALSPA